MTDLAHDCALLGIPVDTARLFDGDDPYYELWLQAVADRVIATKRAQRDREKKAGKRG